MALAIICYFTTGRHYSIPVTWLPKLIVCARNSNDSTDAHLPSFRGEIEYAITGSFRCNASMDRIQLDNQFELLKIVDHVGNKSLEFIGHVTEAGTQGHMKYIRDGTVTNIFIFHIFTNI